MNRVSEVHRAEREDGLPVVLKAFPARGRDGAAQDLARREAEALQAACGPGVPRLVDLLVDPVCPVLVLERIDGCPLERWILRAGPPDSASFLSIAAQLASVLARVHAARLIHGDLQPSNVLIEPETLRVHLVSFGEARPLGSGRDDPGELCHPDRLRHLTYTAPERTGRMGRGADFRSDLYSLGATLYMALTGRPPFESDDALALIHAHMARAPRPPHELRSEVPGPLSRIVLELLQKEPEDRYQTARALERDLLECSRRIDARGQIPEDLALGSADVPHRPLFSKHLYGREEETAALTEAYERAASGRTSWVLVCGPAGIGKSGLVQALRGPLARTRGYLARGKFDPYTRGRPYAGMAQALESFTQQILTESEDRLAAWRGDLRRELGMLAGVLTRMVPDLAIVLGEVAPVPNVGPAETRERLVLAWQRLLRVLATPEHPLVLWVDDVQWADAGSRDLLQKLRVQDGDGRALLVIAGYRTGELDTDPARNRWLHGLEQAGLAVQRLELEPLSHEDCARMLADALGRDVEDTRSLASCVWRKTGNTPLLIQQFVDHVYHLGLFRYASGVGWSWDDAALEAAEIPDDAVALLTARIGRLDAGAREVLELASCVGDRFRASTLAEQSEVAAEVLESALFTLADEGLVVPVQSGFRFAHDRIREAARGLLSPGEAACVHHRAARLLLARLAPADVEERVFEIADHLEQAAACLTEAERVPAIALHLKAARRALHAGVSTTAARHAGAAQRLFAPEDWEAHPELGFDLFMLRAEAAYQQGEFASALAILAELAARPLGRMQAAQVAASTLRVRQIMPGGRNMTVVLDALRRFGLDWPERPSWLRTRWAIWRTDRAFSNERTALSLRPLAPGDHDRWLAPLLLLAASGGSMSVTTVRLVCLSTAFALANFRRHGFVSSPSLALAGYAGYRTGFLRHPRGAERYAHAALIWNERLPHPQLSLRSEYVVHAFVFGWIRPRRELADPLERIAEAALEVGDLEFAYYARLQRANYLGLSGAHLARVEAALDEIGHTAVSLETHRGAIRLLRAGRLPAGALQARLDALASPVEAGRVALMAPWVLWLEVICVLGDWQRAQALVTEIGNAAYEVGPMLSQLADYVFLRGLIAAECRRGWRARRELGSCLRQMRAWARSGPDFVHLAEALEAERARMRGKPARALAHYESAARRAESQGYAGHAALLHERRSALLARLGRGSDAAAALARAAEGYRSWGADTKVCQLEAWRGTLS